MNKLTIFLLFPFFIFAQGEFNQWRFGYGSGLDFNSGPPTSTWSSIQSAEAAASVSDCNGDLLFYTDGQTVWSSNNIQMDEGYDLRGVGSVYPSTQGAIIIKRPMSSAIYYIFTASDIYGINYSVINMAVNGGLGKVIQKNVKLSGSLTQKLGVTYHQNEEDIWVMTHYENSNIYEAFLVTQTGVSPTSVKSGVGPVFTSSHGDIKFNQQGNKVGAVVQDQDLITLADFNNFTGKVSNSNGIIGAYNSPHGCEFSLIGNKFYVTAWGNNGGVIQFNVSTNNSTTLSVGETNISSGFKPHGSLQLAPNGKIYIAHDPSLFSSASYLGVINFPSNSGLSAGFVKNGIYLGSNGSSWELPNATLTNNNIPEVKEIIAAQFCFNTETEFELTNQSGIVDLLWEFDDPNSGVSNFSNELDPNHLFSAPGTYSVKVTITNVCDIEEYLMVVEIDEGPVSNLDSIDVCGNTNEMVGVANVTDVIYSWTPSLALSSTSISNPTFNSSGFTANSFSYYLISTALTGCSFLDTLNINVFEEEKAGDDQLLCPGFGVTLTVDSGVSTALWQGDSINSLTSLNPYVNPIVSSDFIVELTDTNGCVLTDTVIVAVNPVVPVEAGDESSICFGDSIAIGVDISPDSTVFKWEMGYLVFDSNSVETVAFPKISQWFFLTATNDTCTSTDSVFIIVHQLPLVELRPNDTTICFDDTIIFKAIGAQGYLWDFGDGSSLSGSSQTWVSDVSTLIGVVGLDSNQCSNWDTSNVTVLDLPVVSLNNDTAICIGKSTDLLVSGGDNYLWLNNEVLSTTDSLISVFPDSSSIYRVRVNGLNGCYALDSIKVNINQLPKVGVMSDTLICEGSNAYLWASGGGNYIWTPETYLNQQVGAEILSSPDNPITYKVVVTNINGCIDSAETSISLNVNPTAYFNFDYFPSCAGFEVQFTDSSQLADAYIWDFGDGGNSNELNPNNVFAFGSYSNTSLIVANNGICFDTAQVSFEWQKISEFIDVFVPNIITPNGDTKNDCFEIIVPNEFNECTNYEVFNRWGMKVYDSNEFKSDFCGLNAYNNKELSSGTYYYVIDVGDYSLNGFIQLVK